MSTRSIEIMLANPDAPGCLTTIIKQLPLPESAKAGYVIDYIDRQLLPLYAVTEFLKMREIRHPDKPDTFRQEHLYYEADRDKQDFEDRLLVFLLPKTFEAISRKASPPAERWDKTIAIARKISTLSVFEGMTPLIYCRAKSNFSIFRKMKRKNISAEEIFDRLGIRIVVDSVEEAYKVKDAMLSTFAPIADHKYIKPGPFRGQIHPSLRDTLQNQDKTHRAIRINLQDGDDIFEVQITTKEILWEYYSNPTSLAETALYHAYQSTDNLVINQDVI